MKLLILFFACLATALAISSKDIIDEEWESFKLEYGKKYRNAMEEMFRKKIFMENRHKIVKHNQKFLQGKLKYTLGMNKFGDLLSEEFVAKMNGLKRNYKESRINGSSYVRLNNVNVPDEIDWRKEGYVTPIKDQGECGACYTFSTTGALEGQHFRKSGKLVSLSEQNLVDCSKKYGNDGCEGGMMDQTFQYIKDNKGVDTEASYPYEAAEGTCRFSPKAVGATDTGFMDIESEDEDAMKEAVGTVGPVSVGIDASHNSFQIYSTGVYDEPECSPENIDHAVLVVGYGTEDGDDYWLVKNSWGTDWGDQGYIKMSRNKDNQCGIASIASYPLV